MEDILDILYNYSIYNQLLDKDAIKKIMELYQDEFDIDVLKYVNILDKIEFVFGHVTLGSFSKDHINIYYNRILTSVRNELYKTKLPEENQLNNLEESFRKNIHILFIILHEMEHSIQFKLVIDNPNTLESKLINIETEYLDYISNLRIEINKHKRNIPKLRDIYEYIRKAYILSNEDKLYNFNYDISFVERLADLDSMNKIYNMCTYIKEYIPQLLVLMNKSIIERKIRDYDNSVLSPTAEFFMNITGESHFNYKDYLNMSLEDRFRLGFPVSKNEINETKLILKH